MDITFREVVDEDTGKLVTVAKYSLDQIETTILEECGYYKDELSGVLILYNDETHEHEVFVKNYNWDAITLNRRKRL